jgi:hypothetical protein
VETVLARKSLLPSAAMHMWSGLLDTHPVLAHRHCSFLMLTSGATMGGAAETDTAYAPYLSRTQRVGVAVPLFYMRNTKGAAGDWVFDPDFDLKHKCRGRLVAEDNLRGIMRFAVDHRIPWNSSSTAAACSIGWIHSSCRWGGFLLMAALEFLRRAA